MTYSSPSVEACWRLARRHARMYQKLMNTSVDIHAFLTYKAARDAADRIALKIRYGRIPRLPKSS